MTDAERLRRALSDPPEYCGDVRDVLRAECIRLAAIVGNANKANRQADKLGLFWCKTCETHHRLFDHVRTE